MCAKRFQKIPSSLASPYPLTPLRRPVTAADGDRGGRRKKIWAPLEKFGPPLGEAKGGPRPPLERKSV